MRHHPTSSERRAWGIAALLALVVILASSLAFGARRLWPARVLLPARNAPAATQQKVVVVPTLPFPIEPLDTADWQILADEGVTLRYPPGWWVWKSRRSDSSGTWIEFDIQNGDTGRFDGGLKRPIPPDVFGVGLLIDFITVSAPSGETLQERPSDLVWTHKDQSHQFILDGFVNPKNHELSRKYFYSILSTLRIEYTK